MKPASRRELIWTTAAFIVLTIAFTYPQIRLLRTHMAPHYDTLFSVWRLAWIAHQLLHDPRHLFNANIFYPEAHTLAYSDALLLPALIGAPFIWLGMPAVAVHNLLAMGSFVACGVAMLRARSRADRFGGGRVVRGAGLRVPTIPFRTLCAARAPVGLADPARSAGLSPNVQHASNPGRRVVGGLCGAAGVVLPVLRRLLGDGPRRSGGASLDWPSPVIHRRAAQARVGLDRCVRDARRMVRRAIRAERTDRRTSERAGCPRLEPDAQELHRDALQQLVLYGGFTGRFGHLEAHSLPWPRGACRGHRRDAAAVQSPPAGVHGATRHHLRPVTRLPWFSLPVRLRHPDRVSRIAGSRPYVRRGFRGDCRARRRRCRASSRARVERRPSPARGRRPDGVGAARKRVHAD